MQKLIRFIFNSEKSDMAPLTREEYDNQSPDSVRKEAFQRAWETRNFEIQLYWTRATYFWAFITSAFVAYFTVVGSEHYQRTDRYDHAEVYVIVCVGFILSLAWLLTNRGSKQWQRHWEVHVDLLEDRFTGPLYKTVHPPITYSVSKINEIVSVTVALSWLPLGAKYFLDQDLLNLSGRINWLVFGTSLGTLLVSCSMLFGHGRGRFRDRAVTMQRRSVTYRLGSDHNAGEAKTTAPPGPISADESIGEQLAGDKARRASHTSEPR